MTATRIDQDVSLDTPPSEQPPLAWRMWWRAAAGGFLVGVLIVAAALLMRPEPRPVPTTPALTGVVRFAPVGGRVDYAAVWDASRGPGQVSVGEQIQATAPWTVVLTVRAERGETAQCRIYINTELVAEETAADGSSATCVAVAR